jgi:DNA polymerase epsilon subunit 2
MHKFIGKETPARRAVPAGPVSSSPAFATPAQPLKPYAPTPSSRHAIVPIDLPPATLRPLAFRTFTKKHSLTLTSSSLEELAVFIGRHCGSGWREEGLAEKVLEEAAKSWKSRNGGVIVDGAGPELKEILTTLEANMSGGRIIPGAKGLSRQNSSFLLDAAQEADLENVRQGLPPPRTLTREDSQKSFGMSGLAVDDEVDDETLNDVRKWLRVVDAYEQPRLVYNVDKRHFERCAPTSDVRVRVTC